MPLQVLNKCGLSDGALDHSDQLVHGHRAVVAQVDGLESSETACCSRSPSNIVYTGEVPPLCTVSVHRDRIVLRDGLNEPEHAHVQAAARAVHGEISQHIGVHAVQVVVGLEQRFRRTFRCSIRRQRAIARGFFRDGTAAPDAVYAGGGGQNELADLELPAQLQQVEGAEDVGLVAGAGVLHAVSDTGLSREVNDRRNGATGESAM